MKKKFYYLVVIIGILAISCLFLFGDKLLKGEYWQGALRFFSAKNTVSNTTLDKAPYQEAKKFFLGQPPVDSFTTDFAAAPVKIKGNIKGLDIISLKGNRGISSNEAEVTVFYVKNGYRYETVKKLTDQEGYFEFSEDEILANIPEIGMVSKPYQFFLSATKSGYMDLFIFGDGENPKTMSVGTWQINAEMSVLPERIGLTRGQFKVRYYPGQEACAEIALDKMEEFYPLVAQVLGIDANPEDLIFTFNTIKEQGSGDWLAGIGGVSTVCYPWTDDLGSEKVLQMWNASLPHEFGHVFIARFNNLVPYWVNEGMAQYVKNKVNNVDLVCNQENFLPVQELTGENIPYYDTAACFWKLLEQDYPGVLKSSMAYILMLHQQGVVLSDEYMTKTADFLAGVIKPVLVEEYGLSEAEAKTYMNSLMALFHYDPNGL